MKIVLLAAAAVGISLGGCAVQPKVVALRSAFDEVATAEALEPGENMLEGNAFLRQRGGGIVTCAGADVLLIPATAYAKERMATLYGSISSGLQRVRTYPQAISFDPNPPAYETLVKSTKCDSTGRFTFEHVADGEFFVVTNVVWSVGSYSKEGGALMERVHLRSGEALKLVMSR